MSAIECRRLAGLAATGSVDDVDVAAVDAGRWIERAERAVVEEYLPGGYVAKRWKRASANIASSSASSG